MITPTLPSSKILFLQKMIKALRDAHAITRTPVSCMAAVNSPYNVIGVEEGGSTEPAYRYSRMSYPVSTDRVQVPFAHILISPISSFVRIPTTRDCNVAQCSRTVSFSKPPRGCTDIRLENHNHPNEQEAQVL